MPTAYTAIAVNELRGLWIDKLLPEQHKGAFDPDFSRHWTYMGTDFKLPPHEREKPPFGPDLPHPALSTVEQNVLAIVAPFEDTRSVPQWFREHPPAPLAGLDSHHLSRPQSIHPIAPSRITHAMILTPVEYFFI
jgi:hypothetical protein